MGKQSKGILNVMENKKLEVTTIKIDYETKSRLDKIKEHERESYNDIIKKLLNIINIFKKSPALGNKILSTIDRSIKFKSLLNSDKIEKFSRPINSSRFSSQSGYRQQDQGSR